VLTYHQVEPARQLPVSKPGLTVPAARFRWQMLLLRALGYRSIHFEELLSALEGGRPLPRRAVLLTFDDGYAGVYEFALPILRRCGFTATLFLIAEDFVSPRPAVERAFPVVSAAQVAEMLAAGWQIGSHTVTHPRLAELPEAEAREEITRSKSVLEGAFGRKLSAIAYPYGSFGRAREPLVAEAGYSCACSVRFGRTHRWEERFALKRIPVGFAQDHLQFVYRLLWAREEPLLEASA
jgi:peptidoglycan/xylan/chitin deacetylase (PgdA/CDA1 family)